MPKLNDMQLVILTAAAQRDNRLILPLPASLDLDQAGEAGILKGLIKSKLVFARPASRNEPEWAAGPDGARQTLVISDAGLNAIGVAEAEDGGTSRTVAPNVASKKSRTKATAPVQAANKSAIGKQPAPTTGASGSTKAVSIQSNPEKGAGKKSQANRSSKRERPPKRPGKIDQILSLLQRPDGASIEELIAGTGWQAHSLRAALTGLRKRGIAVASDRQDGIRRYKVGAA